MKKTQLSGSPRENVGKKESTSLRKSGRVPAVVYGGNAQKHFSVDGKELSKLLFTPDVFRVALDINGETTDAIIKDAQFHPVSDEILHVDFLELLTDKEVKLKLPVRLTGNSLGVRNGGRLMVHFRKVDIKGFPDTIPEVIEVDITKLRIGHSIRVKDLNVSGVEFLNEPNAIVVQVRAARGAVDEDEEEEGEEGAAEGEAKEGEEKAAE